MLWLWFILFATSLDAQGVQEAQVPLGKGHVKYAYVAAAGEAKLRPMVVALASADPKEAIAFWRSSLPPEWLVVIPYAPGISDGGAKAIEEIVGDAIKRLQADPSRIYLAGAGVTTADVFYTLARVPDVFAAGLAVQGNPINAINSNKLYAANTQAAPLLWLAPPEYTQKLQAKLREAEFTFETAGNLTNQQVHEWLAGHRKPEFPHKVDCESHSLVFARCYWLEVTQPNPRRRNDVVPSTRVRAGTGASLDLGGFGYDPADAGPGAQVMWLPDNYQGPLKLKDRIIAVSGVDIKDGRDYAERLDSMADTKAIAVMVERGKERLRIETKVLLPERETLPTTRVQGIYTPEQNELLVITRGVSGLRVRLPKDWAPVKAVWNGNDLALGKEGCWQLTEKENEFSAAVCLGP
ncbi:MAG: hypothetical protein ACKV22_18410 [Bryobacteraceae bacterium]